LPVWNKEGNMDKCEIIWNFIGYAPGRTEKLPETGMGPREAGGFGQKAQSKALDKGQKWKYNAYKNDMI
jgi:hypothetical protein